MAILINLTKDKNIFACNDLSWKAKGIYLYLKGRKNKTVFSIDKLIESSRDNKTSIYAGFKELERKNLLLRAPIYNKRNKIVHWLYAIYDGEKKLTEKLITEFLQIEKLQIEKLKVVSSSNNTINNNSNINNSVVTRRYNFDEVDRLIKYWKRHIRNHRNDSKAFIVGKERLERKYLHINRNQLLIKRRDKKTSKGFKTIMQAMRLYKKLLNSNDTIFIKREPYLVSLRDFFAFNHFQKKHFADSIEGIGSWYSECSKGEEYCLKRYGRYTTIEEKLLRIHPTKDDDLVKKAAERFVLFYNKNQDKLTLPNDADRESASRFIKYLYKFIKHKFRGKQFRLSILLTKNFLDIEFVEYMQEMEWFSK